MIEHARGRRLYLYLLITIGISWSAWWALVAILQPKDGVFAHPLSILVFSIGGLGPTLAPFIAIALTPAEGSFREYWDRLSRWRLSTFWWVAALAVPPAVAWLIECIDIAASPGPVQGPPLQPLSRLVVLFPMMIVGGGLEELGWRGVLQPELERRFNPILATLLVGFLWALWHLPLFFIPGTAQFETNFGFFALQILGTSFITAWLYANTRSILLCVLFHAAANASSAMGLTAPDVPNWTALLGGAVRLAIGIALLASIRWRGSDARSVDQTG